MKGAGPIHNADLKNVLLRNKKVTVRAASKAEAIRLDLESRFNDTEDRCHAPSISSTEGGVLVYQWYVHERGFLRLDVLPCGEPFAFAWDGQSGRIDFHGPSCFFEDAQDSGLEGDFYNAAVFYEEKADASE